MRTFSQGNRFQKYCQSLKHKGSLGFIPTMGALHEGHLSLIRKAKKQCRFTAVSILVNPLQFGPHEDFNLYPRPRQKDLAYCRENPYWRMPLKLC